MYNNSHIKKIFYAFYLSDTFKSVLSITQNLTYYNNLIYFVLLYDFYLSDTFKSVLQLGIFSTPFSDIPTDK